MEGVTCIHPITREVTESGQTSAENMYCLVPTARKNQEKLPWVVIRRSCRVCKSLQVKRNLRTMFDCLRFETRARAAVYNLIVDMSQHYRKQLLKFVKLEYPAIKSMLNIARCKTTYESFG